MQSSNNRVVIACAGSGKTTHLVQKALSVPDRRIAIITYTNNNAREIIKRFGALNGGLPKHVDVMKWFTFLLHDGARPYQGYVYGDRRISSLAFVNRQSTRGIPESNVKRYYFAGGDAIYSDKISQFVVKCEEATGRHVTQRLQHIYTDIYIDEFQDLAGWDLELVEKLFESNVNITLVGDPRQHIYSTNPARKNRQYQGSDIVKLIHKWEKAGLCCVETLDGTYRCNQLICEFANKLWPGMDNMYALQTTTTGHDGVFLVSEKAVTKYIDKYQPQMLRHDKRARTYGCVALNFGVAKGLEFQRVLVVPTTPIRQYLTTGNISHIEKARDKLHVAVTRARHSVAFVYDNESPVVTSRWNVNDH